MDPQEIVREAEAFCAEAAKPPVPAELKDALLGHLRAMRIDCRAATSLADRPDQLHLHHRFLLLLSEVDKLESDLEGR